MIPNEKKIYFQYTVFILSLPVKTEFSLCSFNSAGKKKTNKKTKQKTKQKKNQPKNSPTNHHQQHHFIFNI